MEALMYSKEVRAAQRAQAAQDEALARFVDELNARADMAAREQLRR